mgnify:CR=1 FL=1
MCEALLYEKLDGRVRCNLCQRRCLIRPGQKGYCKVRVNQDGTLYTLVYGLASSVAVDPIEKKPLFHFYPSSQVFSLGTFGCNFRCIHCQNYTISYEEPGTERFISPGQRLSPERTLELTERYGCGGIAWTYNEPTMWFEYTLDAAKLARERGLYTCYITNGYLTSEALDMIGPYLGGYRVDVKGFSDKLYGRLAHIPHWRGILEVAVRAKERWNMHVEVVTNVIPTWNDDEEQLRGIARWIKGDLGPYTPWHVTRFMPYLELSHLPPTPVSTLERAYKIGRDEGLHFVYLGNVPGHKYENTICYNCGKTAIRRVGYQTQLVGVSEGGKCKNCGADLNIRGL